jgi:ABC-type uncharacterized transport system auxiliary subunit
MYRFIAVTGLTITLCCLSGCLTPNGTLPPDQYLLHAAPQVPASETLSVTLGIRELESARPYHLQMAHMESVGRLNYYQTATWAEFPAAALTRALHESISRTGRFADAGMAEQMSRPDWMLVGYLNAFQEDRTTTPAQAVVEVRLEMRQARATDLLWSATLREVQALDGEGPAALAKAMDAATVRLISQAVSQIVGVAAPAPAE